MLARVLGPEFVAAVAGAGASGRPAAPAPGPGRPAFGGPDARSGLVGAQPHGADAPRRGGVAVAELANRVVEQAKLLWFRTVPIGSDKSHYNR